MALAAIAAIPVVGCSGEELLPNRGADIQTPDGEAVAFGTYLAGAPESRASVIDLPALKKRDSVCLPTTPEQRIIRRKVPTMCPISCTIRA